MLTRPEDVARYREEGWLALGPIASPERVKALLAEEARFRPRAGYGADALRVSVQLCHRSELVRRQCLEGDHVPALRALLGPDVCLTHMQFVTKLPEVATQGAEIPWHQDAGYGRLEPPLDVTVLLALTDMDERRGCLHVVPRSHRGGLREHARAEHNPVLRGLDPGAGALAVPLRAGEAIAFTGLTVHGSGPNHGDVPRVAWYVRYCHPAVRMASEGNRPVLEDPHSWMVCGEWDGRPSA